MRITFVLPYARPTGGIRVLAIYADRLQRRGHEVTLISHPQDKVSLIAKLKSLLRGYGWPKPKDFGRSYLDDVAVPHRVLDRERPVVDADVPDADIVLATFWRTAAGVAALSPRKGAKAIFLQGYETSPGHEDAAIDAAWRLPLRKIVISKWMVDLARDRFGDSDVRLVLNSVDTNQFHAPERGMQTLPTIGMLYSILHLKGTDVALEALKRARERLGRLHVVAFGAVQPVAQLPLPEWSEYHYRPPQDKIRDIYAKCDVWLCASRREGFHLPPLEAMACRCPVVSTAVGGPIDIIEEDRNGFLVPVGDAEALADRLVRVLTLSGDEWRAMSDAALATATCYTWDDATDRLEEALHEIAEGGRAGAGTGLESEVVSGQTRG